MKKVDKTNHAEEMILIPKSQYYKMLESYDRAINELKETKKALIEAATSTRAE